MKQRLKRQVGLSAYFCQLSVVDLLIVSHTPEFSSLYGYSGDNLIGVSITELIPNFELNQYSQNLQVTKLGHHFVADIVITQSFDQEQIIVTVLPLRRVDETIYDSNWCLLSGMAHELNTPTGNIILSMSVLKDRLANLETTVTENKLSKSQLLTFIKEQKNALSVVNVATSRVSEIVEKTKSISVVEVLESLSKFYLVDTINKIVSVYNTKLKDEQIKLNIDCDQETELVNDETAFIQIFEQLLDNAIQHAFRSAQSNSKEINLSVHKNPGSLSISYSDNGVGMDETVSHKVFEPFFTTDRKNGAIGLGLTIVYNIVTKRLHGNVHSAITSGQGCFIDIEIPLLTDVLTLTNDENIVFLSE